MNVRRKFVPWKHWAKVTFADCSSCSMSASSLSITALVSVPGGSSRACAACALSILRFLTSHVGLSGMKKATMIGTNEKGHWDAKAIAKPFFAFSAPKMTNAPVSWPRRVKTGKKAMPDPRSVGGRISDMYV